MRSIRRIENPLKIRTLQSFEQFGSAYSFFQSDYRPNHSIEIRHRLRSRFDRFVFGSDAFGSSSPAAIVVGMLWPGRVEVGRCSSAGIDARNKRDGGGG
jgi:hypothetical protein